MGIGINYRSGITIDAARVKMDLLSALGWLGERASCIEEDQ